MLSECGGVEGHGFRVTGFGLRVSGFGFRVSGLEIGYVCPMKSYQELDVWQVSMQLAKEVYGLTGQLPKEETYGLSSQFRRAAVSIPSNIAEGYGRSHRGEYLQFLGIAQGSQSELTTLLLLARDLYSLGDVPVLDTTDRVGQMLTKLRASLMRKA